MSDQTTYTGQEAAVDWTASQAVEPETVFDVRSPSIPAAAVPIFDEELKAVVGYRHESATGVFKIYDLDGNMVDMEEKGLEEPLIDPIDLIFIFGGLIRGLTKGAIRMGTRTVAATGARLTVKSLASAAATALRAAFRRVSVRSLKFTATTAARMGTAGRHVPLHILHLAIKYGKRVADPQGVKGAFQYTIPMIRNGKQYILEVVVREKDWTILHFLYK